MRRRTPVAPLSHAPPTAFPAVCARQYKGRFPNRVLRRHFKAAELLEMEPHFTDEMAFIRHIIDPVSGKPARRIHQISNATKDLASTLQASRQAGEDKCVAPVRVWRVWDSTKPRSAVFTHHAACALQEAGVPVCVAH